VSGMKKGQKTALHLAAQRGHASVVKRLLHENADATVLAEDDWSPLHCSVIVGSQEVVLPFLAANSDLVKAGSEALHIAAAQGHGISVEMLLQGGANISATNDKRLTPLHLAAENGAVNILLHAGADVDARDDQW